MAETKPKLIKSNITSSYRYFLLNVLTFYTKPAG